MSDVNLHTAWMRAVLRKFSDERGLSDSTEKVLWVIFAVAMVGIVSAGIQAYLQGRLARIR